MKKKGSNDECIRNRGRGNEDDNRKKRRRESGKMKEKENRISETRRKVKKVMITEGKDERTEEGNDGG